VEVINPKNAEAKFNKIETFDLDW